jgi:hypothetical protein
MIDELSFRRRFSFIDHEKNNMIDVATLWVLNPAKNPADLAAIIELTKNVPPEMAKQLLNHLKLFTDTPEGRARTLGGFGEKCLPHITNEDVVQFARERLAQVGKRLVIDDPNADWKSVTK